MNLNPDRWLKWAQLLVAASILLGGGAALGGKALAIVKAGPEAKHQTQEIQGQLEALELRVERLEDQMFFVVAGMEQLTQRKYRAARGRRP